MASGIFAVLDDIAALMDDVSVAAKVATKKTAGILGDDLAVNAEKASGFISSREIPVLLAITKGSFLNKLIIIPVVLTLNTLLPTLIKIVLILGGFYLAYEGVEKIFAYLFDHEKKESTTKTKENTDQHASEKAKIKSAIFTDFILSIEIIIIALSTVLEASLPVQIATVAIISILATVGVYGIVALIVRMDDVGFKLIKISGNHGFLAAIGRTMVKLLPWVIRSMGVVGTLALILVAGGVFMHQTHFFETFLPNWFPLLREALLGLTGGLLSYLIYESGKRLFVQKQK